MNTQLQTAILVLLALLVIAVSIVAIQVQQLSGPVLRLANSPTASFIAGIGAS